MKRISTATAVNNKFVDGDKSTGQKSTQLNAEWFNQVQEEICNLLEAAGITVGADGADNQLMQLFTSLFVLQATLKSATCKKSFEGGCSAVTIDGEKLDMTADGSSVTDNSSLNMSRMQLQFQKSAEGGMIQSEFSPTGLIVKAVGSNDTVLIEVKNDAVIFKSGDPLTVKASISYDSSTGNLSVSTASGMTVNKKIDASSGGLKGDLEADVIEPMTAQVPVTIGSVDGGVALVGRTTGFKGDVQTNTIYPINDTAAVVVGSAAGGAEIAGRTKVGRLHLDSSYVKVSSDYSLLSFDGSSPSPLEGDIVVVENEGSSDITVTMAMSVIPGSGTHIKQMTLQAKCSMAFICNGVYENNGATSSSWSPLSNTTVTTVIE